MKYYKRDIERILRQATKQFRVVVLTGARQTGKSTLLKHLFNSSHQYITLDDPKNLKLAQEDPELFFSEYNSPLIIDEIQYAPNLLHYIKIMVDSSSKRGQYIITGSQQFTLIKGLQETLAGRAVLFNLLPMAITEGPESSKNYPARALHGSYPELNVIPKMDSDLWYASYINTYIEKDVQMHYRIEKITFFKNLLFLLTARTSQILNYQSLANDLGVSAVIIKTWIKILEASQIIYLLKPYSRNLGSRIVKSPKIYFNDIGLVSYIAGNTSETSIFRGPQAGALFENFVIQELIKLYTNMGKMPPLYYYRNNSGLEVDLIVEEKPGQLRLCEIKLSKTPHKGMLNSIDRLRKLVGNKADIKDAYVIAPVERSFPLSSQDRACSLEKYLRILLKPLNKKSNSKKYLK